MTKTLAPPGVDACAGGIAFYLYADPLGLKTQAATESRKQNLGVSASLSFDESTQGA